jgi:hypothetical protein
VSDRIAELATLIAGRIPGLIEEARDQINEAINAAMEDAQEKEGGKAVLSLAITAKWDLDGDSVVISMPVAVRRKFEVVGKLQDPNQESLPFTTTEEDLERDQRENASLHKAVKAMDRALEAGSTALDIKRAILAVQQSKGGAV